MGLDLNLLTALDALLEEGSVANAADRLDLSQPAMSRTLGRIRRSTGDQILVRTGRTMTPTPYALAVREDVHALVQHAHALLVPERDLDLDSLTRTFTLQCHDAITTAIGSRLLAAVQAQAPGVTLRLLAEAAVDTTDLRQGRVDISIGSEKPAFPEIRSETIFHERLVMVVRLEHPFSRGHLTIERYAQAHHITISRRGHLRDPVDAALVEHGLQRHVVASAPTTMAALYFVKNSDMVVAVAEHLCEPMVSALGLRSIPIPLDLPTVPAIIAWHQRYDNDKAHSWIRNLVRETLQATSPSRAPSRPGH